MEENMNNNEVQNNYNPIPNNNYEEPKNNNGMKALLAILIVGVFLVVGLLTYKIFVTDKKNNNEDGNTVEKSKESSPTTVDNNETTKNVPVEDTFAIYLEKTGNEVYMKYYVLDNGSVYESNALQEKANPDFYQYGTSILAKKELNLKKVSVLSNVKRIKGTIGIGSDASTGLLVVTNDGEVLIYNFRKPGDEGTIIKAKFLDEYKVDDIIDYSFVPVCVNVNDDPNFKTCGGSYHIMTTDGNEYNYTVKTDGTLVKR